MDTRVIAACVVVAAAAGSCRRSPVESPSARVDELFAEWNKPDSPGCSVGISQNGTVVYEHGYVTFVPAGPGRPQEVHVTGDGPKPTVSTLVTETFTPSSVELGAFPRDYVSRELDTTYTIKARAAGLVIQIQGRADIDLQPILPDTFTGGLVGMVKFSRDARGHVAGFTVNAPDVRGLRFERK